jgi:hypothetical protein
MAIAKTQKTSKNTAPTLNARCDELENIISRLEARIVELEGNLNQNSSASDEDDGWRERVIDVLRETPVLRKAVDRNNL